MNDKQFEMPTIPYVHYIAPLLAVEVDTFWVLQR
jgi:hypothetical protein